MKGKVSDNVRATETTAAKSLHKALLGDFKAANATKSTAVAFGRNKVLAVGYLPLCFALSPVVKSCISQTSFVI